MCGRYLLLEGEELAQIIAEINRKAEGEDAEYAERAASIKAGEIYPTDAAPVLAFERGSMAPGPMRWGFPRWDGKGVVINARAETAAQKGMFKGALGERRLAIPTSGFYEWRHEGKRAKEKYLFRRPKDEMLYLAGLYERFDVEGRREARFAILTTAANESMAPFHDRMPVLLGREECEAWLCDSGASQDILGRVPMPLEASAARGEKPEAGEAQAEQQSFF